MLCVLLRAALVATCYHGVVCCTMTLLRMCADAEARPICTQGAPHSMRGRTRLSTVIYNAGVAVSHRPGAPNTGVHSLLGLATMSRHHRELGRGLLEMGTCALGHGVGSVLQVGWCWECGELQRAFLHSSL